MCKINDGEIVAKIRATPKGKKIELPSGLELGGKGVDGRKWYEIRKQAKNSWTCSCPAYRFKKGEVGKKSPCKHMLKLFTEWKSGNLDYEAFRIYRAEDL
jgi:hypothetical protein